MRRSTMRLIATRVAAGGNVGSTPVCDFERVVVSPMSVWQHVAGLRRRPNTYVDDMKGKIVL